MFCIGQKIIAIACAYFCEKKQKQAKNLLISAFDLSDKLTDEEKRRNLQLLIGNCWLDHSNKED